MSFADLKASHVANCFLRTDQFAESVDYKDSNGDVRTIRAIVDRDPPSLDGQATRPKMRVTVANNSTTGILSSELNTGTDTITLAYRKGDTATAYRIRRSPDTGAEDSAVLTIELH